MRKQYETKIDAERKDRIISNLQEFFFISRRTLRNDQTTYAVMVRYVAMYLMYTEAGYEHKQIGKLFGQDHTCSVKAVQKIQGILSIPHTLQAERIYDFFDRYGYHQKMKKATA